MTVVSLDERRKYPRISDALAMRLDSDTSTPMDSKPTHIVKMSCGGLRFVHSTAVDTDTNIKLSVYLPTADQTVHLASKVISSGEEKSDIFSSAKGKQYFVQVEFLDVDQEVHQLLASHINSVMNKTGMTHRLTG